MVSSKNPRSSGPLDDIDTQLVELLKANARMPNSRLAELVGVAQSTCITRVRSLEDRGVITGYTARVAPGALGLSLQALISVSIKSGARQSITAFSDDIGSRTEVLQLFFLGGAEDFVIHVATRDSDHLREFVVANLSAHPSVASTRTSIVFEHVVN
ncbi:Lrp/AsnC family transcriptional regulator [Subtercola frigoramans]|uniref:DNA-binding Lrp family transcriptional regulator n=1 Tax=Subtercola frigoramans TaxID=120298 RepID=A0ABS2L1A7_9MICO|nr:Lrp/AsnC family transcriptional regulator [Subtercola frigoramans]MBM7470853.1 DNA-binding Lrp family transcriptional regulator [Subtercola frigoramans]